jgi:probable phosphoglycerate mutase
LRVIALCRHGVTESNAQGRFLSRTDLPLSPAGRAQCRELRELLAGLPIERCIVSPMRRCLETREILAPALPFEIQPALREVDFGAWEGRTLSWLEANDPQGLSARRQDPVHFRPPEGESFADVAQRLSPLVDPLRSGASTLVIAHRGSLGVLERLLRGLPLDSRAITPLEPCELHVVELL